MSEAIPTREPQTLEEWRDAYFGALRLLRQAQGMQQAASPPPDATAQSGNPPLDIYVDDGDGRGLVRRYVEFAPPDAKRDLFVEGEFTAHSGATLFEKIECDALTEADWYCLARMIHRRLAGRYLEAFGIPRGGVMLAQKLNALSRADQDTLGNRPNLVVDDVLTSGNSLREHLRDGRIGFVVFDRSGGKNLPPNCRALFTLDAVVGSFPHSNGPPQSST